MRPALFLATILATAAPALAQQAPQPAAPAQTAPRVQTAPATAGGAAQPGAATAPSGVQTMTNIGSVQLNFYSAQPTDTVASRLRGTDVYNAQNESVGEIEDFVIENGRTIRAVVIGVGGFLGLGERYVAVDPNSVVLQRQGDGEFRAAINGTRESLRNAPEFRYERR